MAAPQTVIRGNNASTASYELPPGVFQYIQSVHVVVNNTAGPDVRPTLSVETQDGVVMASKRQGEAIPAGDTGSATWALRLADESAGGIRFGRLEVGNWLSVTTTAGNPDNGRGIRFDSGSAGMALDTGTDFGSFPDVGGFDLYTGGVSITAGTNGFSVGTSPDGPILLQTGGLGGITIQSATSVTITTLGGDLDLTASADVNISPGGGLSFFNAAAVAQQATPVTLGDVIALLQAYGLAA